MAIEVTFLEQGRQRPADMATLLAEFISAARTSLHLAIYDFRLTGAPAETILSALRDRSTAGVDVRIVYDAGKPVDAAAPNRGDPAPPGTADFLRRLGGNIPVKPVTGGDPLQPKLMHQKYIVRDAATPQAAVWTGSTNWTDDSWTLQENNIIRIFSPELCSYYETDFLELWERGDIASTGKHDKGRVRIDQIDIDIAFAPGEGDAIDHKIARLVHSANRRIKLCSMLLTSSAILKALTDKRQRTPNVEYTGIYDRTQMESVLDQWRGGPADWKIPVFQDAVSGLAGKQSTPYTPGGIHDFMHNKVMVIDDVVITGSYNLSHSATQNAENCLMIHDAVLAQRYTNYIDGLIKRYGG